MSSESSEPSQSIGLSLVAQFDEINRMNDVLNDGYAEECFLAFAKNQEWCRKQWLAAQNEAERLQHELDQAMKELAQWEGKFANIRQLLDNEKYQRKLAVKKCEALEQQMAMARDLLFNDNRNKLNNETLEKLAFLNATGRSIAEQQQQKLDMIPELNSTGTMISEMSYSRSEDLDHSISRASVLSPTRRHKHRRSSPPTSPKSARPTKKRRSSCSSATKVVELEDGKVLATATTTLTLERARSLEPEIKKEEFQPRVPSYLVRGTAQNMMSDISDKETERSTTSSTTGSSTERPGVETETSEDSPPRRQYVTSKLKEFTPTAPPRTETETGSECNWNSPRTQQNHKYVTKTFYKHEICSACGKRIKFAKTGSRCENCRAAVHAECRNLLPLPCLPPTTTMKHNLQLAGIADYAPSRPPMVPALLVHCINEVEKRGLTERGLYRICGQEVMVKKLKERFLRGGCPPLAEEDIHVVCGTIKDFLRTLAEPLITNSLWDDVMEAGKLPDQGDATAALIQVVSQLPPPNRDTLAFLVLHVQKVAESAECEMSLESLAKMFAPTVIGYSTTPIEEMYSVTSHLVQVMLSLLRIPSEYWTQYACPSSTVGASPGPHTPPTPQLLRMPSSLKKPKGFFW